MISVYSLKPKFQSLLLPVLKALRNMGVTANHITWSAVLLSVLTGIILWIHPYGLALIVLPLALLLRMALNALDGMMARTYKMESKSGEVLNEFGDVISDIVMFFPLIKLFSPDSNIFIAFIFLSILNEFAGVLGKAVSGKRQYDGPMGKSDRALVIGILSLILFFWSGLLAYMNFIFLGMIALLIISTSIRIVKTLK